MQSEKRNEDKVSKQRKADKSLENLQRVKPEAIMGVVSWKLEQPILREEVVVSSQFCPGNANPIIGGSNFILGIMP